MSSVALSDLNLPSVPGQLPAWEVLATIGLSCNVLINLFGTINIVVRLLLHRRLMIATFGRSPTLSKYHIRISGILLESAALNIPVTLLVITCLFVGRSLTQIAMTIVAHGQV